jgi:D-alanyl-D-alanine dipeptidase
MTRRMPRATKHEMEDAAQRFTARPQASGHQTGGAFDVTLGDQQGTELDLGTHVKQATNLTRTRARGLTGEHAARRKILVAAMQSAGFINYPAEWWHFSYGDRLWAAYTRNKIAIYDVLDE